MAFTVVKRERPIIWDIVEDHLDDAAFLSEQWERALVSPESTLAGVAQGAEARLLAHLDGIASASSDEVVPRLLEPRLASRRPDEVFVAALARFERPGDTLAWLPSILEQEELVVSRPVLRALGLARRADLGKVLRGLLERSAPVLQAGVLSALALRGEPVRDLLPGLMKSESPLVKAAVLGAIRGRGAAHRDFILDALDAPEPPVRAAALQAGTFMGLPAAVQGARALVEARAPGCDFALGALAVSGEAADAERLMAALEAPGLRAGATFALGFSGWPHAAETCLRLMEDAPLARLAGEAFSRVTGLMLEGRYAYLDEEDEHAHFETEDLDADLVPGPEVALPLPDVEAVAGWWSAEKGRFPPGVRCHRGRPLTSGVLRQALRQDVMRGRDVRALELALRTRGAVRIQASTWAFLQLGALAGGRV